MNKRLCLLVLPLLLAGCTTISNLTPSQYPRTADSRYRLEASWRTSQQSIRPESIKPTVVIGFNSYEMHPIPLVEDRWEAFVPVPADTDVIYFRYKFDFMKNSFGGKPRPDSLMSSEYKLRITP